MKPQAPKQATLLAAIILFVLGFLGFVSGILIPSVAAVWLLIVSNVLLIAGCLIKGI
ncbi:MAG: hypothetical protein ACE5K0_03735 [Candidatus Methanofastidiosia archaeon]